MLQSNPNKGISSFQSTITRLENLKVIQLSISVKNMSKRKLLIIGIDGADLDIFTNIMKFNISIMPTLSALIQEGMYGKLRSTIPPSTIPAWTSSVTGVDLDKHGLYDFFLSVDLEEKRIEYADRTKRKHKAIWNILGEHGLKVIVVNVPVTYPPEYVNGVLVSGLLTPSLKSDFTYPASIKEELIRLGYRIDVGDFMDHVVALKHNPIKYIEELRNLINIRVRAIEYLTQEFNDWDCLMVVFTEIDRLQHWFMNHIIKRSYLSSLILTVYNEVDSAVARLLALSGGKGNINVIIYSDHGFRPVRNIIFLNNILRRHGLIKVLSMSRGISTFLPTQERILQYASKSLLVKLLRLIPTSFKRKIGLRIPVSKDFHEVLEVADPFATKAFLFSGFIRLSRDFEPEEKYKIINKIRIIKKNMLSYGILVLHKSEVYRKPWIAHMPEFPILGIGDIRCSQLIPNDPSLISMEYTDRVNIPSLLWTGVHRLHGMVILHGPMLRGARGLIPEARIVDIAPSVLKALGVPIPKYMDGRPIF